MSLKEKLLNPKLAWLIIDVILVMIVYVIIFMVGPSYNLDTEHVLFAAFTGFIASKYLLHVGYGILKPSKCILQTDGRTCRF
jgi:uncharacterized membrane protein